MTIADCITQPQDYEDILQLSCELTNGLLRFDVFTCSETDDEFTLNVTINGEEEVFKVPFTSDYLEVEELVPQLNTLLANKHPTCTKKFISLDGSCGADIDCGIGFISEEERLSLKTGGYFPYEG